MSNLMGKENSMSIVNTWKMYFSDTTNKVYFIGSVFICISLSIFTAKILAWNSHQSGSVVFDPVMDFLTPAKDWSLAIFMIEYMAILVIFMHTIKRPKLFIDGLWGVAALFMIRTLVVKMVPLAPPHDIIYIKDPFLQFFYGEYEVKNDLFFSGHTSLVLLFFFIAKDKWVKTYLLMSGFLVALLLVWQHAHFIYDVSFAVIPSYLINRFIVNQPLSKGILDYHRAYISAKP